MKNSPQDKELHDRLGPSKFSSDGFLGNSNLSVDELINNDKKKLNELGINSLTLARKLESIYSKAERAFGAEIKIKPGVYAKFFESRGKIPSPFKGHGIFEKGETVILDRINNREFIITKLGISMIKTYSFFQGHGSRYRIDPESLIHLLEISFNQ